MKTLKSAIIVLIALLWMACSNKKGNQVITDTTTSLKGNHAAGSHIKGDTLTYIFKKLRADEKNCKQDCNYVEVNYPVFKNNPGLNAYVTDQLFVFLNDGKKSFKNIDTAFKAFADDFVGDAKDDTTQQIPPSTLDQDMTISRQDSSLIVIDITQEMTGGAHPNTGINYINWNTKADKLITLKDLLINNYGPSLTQIAEKIFRKDKKLGAHQSLEADFNFEHNTFALNNNFYLSPKGINFYYNSYEIQAYVYGPTALSIPYTSIKQLLRPNTVISQYIK